MSSAKVIIWNVCATYGRSLLSFVLSLFTARWVLEALGETDFGLYGVVGGVMFFVSVLNITQNTTIARFFAYAIGRGSVGCAGNQGVELCEWFNTAISIHAILPVALIVIGYPVGVYALETWLNIPLERLHVCVWILRFSMISLFASIITVPYSAMFVAHQKIALQVGLSFIQVLGYFIVAYSLYWIQGDRLIAYGLMMMALHLLCYSVNVFVAWRMFPACRVNWGKMFDVEKIVQMVKYTFYKLIGDVSWGARTYGECFVANVNFGPASNAALNVATQLATQSASLCNTLATAFSPAITTEEGSGRRSAMQDMAIRCCKFGSVLIALVCVPLLIEIDVWLKLWLKNPPANCTDICVCLILTNVIIALTKGHELAIHANGDISKWQLCDAVSHAIAVPVACLFVWMGMGIQSIGYSFLVSSLFISWARMVFARRLVGLSLRRLLREVIVPIGITVAVSSMFGRLSAAMMSDGFAQLVLVTVVSCAVCVSVAWFVVLNSFEREFIVKHMMLRFKRRNAHEI